MKNRSKKLLFMLMLTCSVMLLATGCDKLKKAPETESETEKVTEAPTESETEKVTEPPTESETQTESETETESETQPKVLTEEEEKAQETEFDTFRTVYAADDINVRTAPSQDGEIFDSFDQGESIMVIGETPNWYVVDLEEYEDHGYVSKQFVSDQEVAPKTESEREALANGTSSAGGSGETSPSSTGSSSVDAEFSVEMYAESFPIQATAGANMRQTPSQDGEIINTIASGTNVTAVGYTDRWYKIDYNGTIGYVNKNLFAAE